MEYCEEKKERLMDLALGEILGADQVELEAHLAVCAGCRKRVEEDRALVGMLKSVELAEPSQKYLEGLSEKVFKEVQASRQAPKKAVSEISRTANWQPAWHSRLKMVAIAASLMLLLFGKLAMKVDGPGMLPPGGAASISKVVEQYPLEMAAMQEYSDTQDDSDYYELDEMFMGEDAEQLAELDWSGEDIAVESYDMYDYLENITEAEAEDLLNMLENGGELQTGITVGKDEMEV